MPDLFCRIYFERTQLFSLGRGQCCDSVGSARVNPFVYGYLKKSVEGKQEMCAKAQDGWPPTPIALPG